MESVLLYGSETWTVINKIAKSLDACYTRKLKKTVDVIWREHITKRELYGDLAYPFKAMTVTFPSKSSIYGNLKISIILLGICLKYYVEYSCSVQHLS